MTIERPDTQLLEECLSCWCATLEGALPVRRCRSCTYFLAAEQLSPCCSCLLHTHVMQCDINVVWA